MCNGVICPRGLIASLLLGGSSEWNKPIASQTSARARARAHAGPRRGCIVSRNCQRARRRNVIVVIGERRFRKRGTNAEHRSERAAENSAV